MPYPIYIILFYYYARIGSWQCLIHSSHFVYFEFQWSFTIKVYASLGQARISEAINVGAPQVRSGDPGLRYGS